MRPEFSCIRSAPRVKSVLGVPHWNVSTMVRGESTVSTSNVELLRKTLEHITAHREEWDQTVWAVQDSCGTAYCLAGTTCILNGDTVDWSRASGLGEDRQCLHLTTGELIQYRAISLLGLTVRQADSLFCPCNTLRDLWEIAADITDREIEVPNDLPNESWR
jgi:hypothetical protein